MKYKKELILICLIILLFSIASVCAIDSNEATRGNEKSTGLIKNPDNYTVNMKDNVGVNETADKIGGVEDNQSMLENARDIGSFEELSKLIENTTEGNTLELNKDYQYANGSTEGIQINKAITIDGKGHLLNGNQLSRAFNVRWNVTLRNINFVNCSADVGGAIRWHGDKGFVSNCSFVNCSATKRGGGAILGAVVSNCSFVNCSTSYIDAMFRTGGGAISDSVVSNCTFVRCYSYYGGAISDSVVSNCTFEDCSASVGGAIWRSIVSNCTFSNCSASVGGAVGLDNRNATVFNCDFVNCSAEVGGAIMLNVDYGTIFNCSFMKCSAVNGGAICWDVEYSPVLSSHDGVVLNCSFINCSANENGGAIEWIGENATVYNSSFVNCSAKYGGAIYNGVAKNCTFNNNKADEGSNCYPNVTKLNLIVSNFNSTYGSNDTIFLNATNEKGIAVNNVVITIRVYKNNILVGTYYHLTNQDWQIDLDAGNYTAAMSVENKSYELTKKVEITVYKVNSSISVSAISFDYGSSGSAIVTLSGADNFTASISDHPESVSISENEITVTGLNAGTYTLSVASVPDANHNSATEDVTVEVKKLATSVSGLKVTTVYGTCKNITVTLKDGKNNVLSGRNVSVKLNGVTYSNKVTNTKGQISIAVPKNLIPKTYTASITFAGDANYAKSTGSVEVTVKKATPKLTAKAKAFKVKSAKKYRVILKTNQNKVMKNTAVNIKIGKITLKAKTNAKGIATFNLAKLNKKGNFVATVKFAGNKYYNAKAVKVKIAVK